MRRPGPILRRRTLACIAASGLAFLTPSAFAMPDAAKVFADPATASLAAAAQAGDSAQVASLLHAGADVRAVGAGGLTPPHFALLAPREKAPTVLGQLLDAGGDPISRRADGESLPRLAALRDHADPAVVQVLLDHGVSPDWRPASGTYANASLLAAAIDGRNFEVVKLLVARGADVNYVNPFDGSALHVALALKQFDIAAWLVDHGIDLGLRNNTSPAIRNPRAVPRTAPESFCDDQARLRSRPATYLPEVRAGWTQLQAALKRRGTQMPCDL